MILGYSRCYNVRKWKTRESTFRREITYLLVHTGEPADVNYDYNRAGSVGRKQLKHLRIFSSFPLLLPYNINNIIYRDWVTLLSRFSCVRYIYGGMAKGVGSLCIIICSYNVHLMFLNLCIV